MMVNQDMRGKAVNTTVKHYYSEDSISRDVFMILIRA